jgi:integrase
MSDVVDQITIGLSKPYFRKILKRLRENNQENADIICKHILTEQAEFNIKNSTKEGKIKILVWLSNFFGDRKRYQDMTKEDILAYLNKLRKPQDQGNGWINSYNNRQMVFLKFFKWLYNQNEPDLTKRVTPPCMLGVKRLTKREKTAYKPSDIWDERDVSVFLKYCPNKRDRCYYAMAFDMSARPHEILSLRIKDIKFCVTDNNKQYVEVKIPDGKTGSRVTVLIDSIPYLKEWLLEHPHSSNPNVYIFIIKNGARLTYDGLASRSKYYEKNYYPSLLSNTSSIQVEERDKSIIKNLVTKPWNLYVWRHSALTKKSQFLTEANLRSHAGWTPSSKMPQVYVHLSGESNNAILEKKGIITKEIKDKENSLNGVECPNCNERCKPNSKFCGAWRMVLTYDSYSEVRNEDKQKIFKLQNDIESLKVGINNIMNLIQQNPVLAYIKPEIIREKIELNIQ